MADVLIFDPASEFELIEEIDFEEEIQRPEELRFFTLDEQLLDYFDKVLPKKKNITKFEYETISKEIDRVRDLYNKIITITDTDYRVEFDRKVVNVDWILPIYEDFQLTSYSYSEKWMPLFERGARSQPNFYPRMLAAMPRPYKTTSSSGVPLTKSSILVDEEGKNAIHARGIYERTRHVVHEDGSFSIVKVPVGNTEDDIRVRGYFLSERGVEIPNSLANHPFLESVQPGKVISNEPLLNIFPTTEAILTHGVPVTVDPYTEGNKYLKVYDVKLSQVPWHLWRDRFPPVDMITSMPPVTAIGFPAITERSAPSKSLQESYALTWNVGIEPRTWLMRQEDGGAYVIKMLLSKAGDTGRVPPETPGEKPQATFPKSTPDECFVDGNFDALLNSGVYRSPGVCVPAAYISQERQALISVGKRPWSDSTEFDILRDHQKLLKTFQHKRLYETEQSFEKHMARPESELRKEVRALLDDKERTPEDKADAIQKLVRELPVVNSVFLDSTSSFVVCGHTLSELNGDMEADRLEFYTKWTAVDEGFQTCKFCGERINSDVIVQQDEFDDSGHLVVSHEVLSGNTYHGESHVASFTNSLRGLQKVFILENVGEAILYLLLSSLQVLPEESQVLPILENIRVLTSVIRVNKKIPKADKDRIEGILGLAGMVILLQAHNPFLIPRRSFGSKVLKFTGFPRDSEDATDSPVLDTLISVLKSTFESLPSTFKGPVTAILRAIITNSKKIRTETIVYIKQSATKFQILLQSAKERYVAPAELGNSNIIQLPLIRSEKQEFRIGERLGIEEMMSECSIDRPKGMLISKLPPSVVQEQLELWKSIRPSTSSQIIKVDLEEVLKVTLNLNEVKRRVALGVPKGFKIDKAQAFLRSDTDATAFLLFLSRLLDILSRQSFQLETIQKYRTVLVFLDSQIDKSLLRDSARGFIFELLHDVAGSSNKSGLVQAIQTAIQKDIVMSMILITKDDAEKQDNELRAREREVFKQRMRQLNDTEREVTKMLLDIGIAPYIIRNEDREMFAREYRYPDPDAEYAEAEKELDSDRPEEGFATPFDFVDNGDDPLTDDGRRLPVDNGGYGERMDRQFEEYETISAFNFDEGDGV